MMRRRSESAMSVVVAPAGVISSTSLVNTSTPSTTAATPSARSTAGTDGTAWPTLVVGPMSVVVGPPSCNSHHRHRDEDPNGRLHAVTAWRSRRQRQAYQRSFMKPVTMSEPTIQTAIAAMPPAYCHVGASLFRPTDHTMILLACPLLSLNRS